MRKHLYQVALVLALSATFAFAQTTPNASHNPSSATPQADQSSQAPSTGDMDRDKTKAGAVDEDTIQRQVKEQLATNPSFSGVNVDVKKDVVTLSGDVPAKDDRTQAKNLAQAVPGVKKVRDHMKVNASAANSVGATGATSNQAAAPSTAGSIAGNTEAQAGVSSGSVAPGATPSASASQSASIGQQQSTTTSSTTAIPQSDVTGSQSSTQTTGQTGSQPATTAGSPGMPQSDVNAGQSSNPAGQTGAMGAGSSSDLQGQIENAIKADTSLSSCNTNVNVTDTQIELTGTRPTGKERQSAKRTAQSFAGNRKVVDHIRVTGKGHNAGTENMGTGAGTSTNPSSGTNPPTSSGTTPPSSSYPQPPL